MGWGLGAGVGVGLRGGGGVKVEVRGRRSRSGGDIEGEEPNILAASEHAKLLSYCCAISHSKVESIPKNSEDCNPKKGVTQRMLMSHAGSC